jgi:peptide/nickel transport system ATP-binding protein
MSDLVIDNLAVAFRNARGQRAQAVDGISLTLKRGELLCLVGESGCGKSVTSLAVMGLLPRAEISGRILFEGRDLLALSEAEMAAMRGNRIAMIFQDPMSSLNPVLTIGRQIREGVMRHQRLGRRAAQARAIDMLDRVGIPDPRTRVDDYPHQLSGGMRQRAMIAMALACDPAILIADEPTTALDVTIQAQILALIDDLKRDIKTAVLLITHDLGVVAETADRVAVMYAGRIVEQGAPIALFGRPHHGYTHGLMRSMPLMNETSTRLAEIPGMVPLLETGWQDCAFAPRCAFAGPVCSAVVPPLAPVAEDHQAACLRAGAVAAAWEGAP